MSTPKSIAPPSMPIAPPQYDRVVQDQIYNVIRLHFTLQDNTIAGLITAVDSVTTLHWLGGM